MSCLEIKAVFFKMCQNHLLYLSRYYIIIRNSPDLSFLDTVLSIYGPRVSCYVICGYLSESVFLAVIKFSLGNKPRSQGLNIFAFMLRNLRL